MTNFDRITTDNWTVAFPSDWVDQAQEDGTLYFESPEGDKGFYIALWNMSESENRSPIELVRAFQKTELSSFFPEDEDWEVLQQTVLDQHPALGYWEGFSNERNYRISGKQLAARNLVLRATFHDYDCTNTQASAEYFAPIVDSLELLEA
ncbi:MAG TPA: hypothetical protein PK743_10150 [Luteimonas sp.]|nr:hypothetical protein [Luteimonas sp.]HRP72983.1 hypothetical protein [Luteimonas sp.]